MVSNLGASRRYGFATVNTGKSFVPMNRVRSNLCRGFTVEQSLDQALAIHFAYRANTAKGSKTLRCLPSIRISVQDPAKGLDFAS